MAPQPAGSSAFPEGWDEARVKRILAYCESQTDEKAAAEDEAAEEFNEPTSKRE
jgi:hypothetical protein